MEALVKGGAEDAAVEDGADHRLLDLFRDRLVGVHAVEDGSFVRRGGADRSRKGAGGLPGVQHQRAGGCGGPGLPGGQGGMGLS